MSWNTVYDVVVLIDCWEERIGTPYIAEFYDRLLKKLSTMHFQNVCFATYPNEDFKTEPRLINNIKNASNTFIDCQHARNIIEITGKFELANLANLNVLIGGMSWNHCVHWRELGIVNWILQNRAVETHPQIVWREGDRDPFDLQHLLDDPIAKWFPLSNVDGTIRSNALSHDIPQLPQFRKDNYY